MASEMLTQEGLHWCETLLDKGLPLSLEAQRTLLAAARQLAAAQEAQCTTATHLAHEPDEDGRRCAVRLAVEEHARLAERLAAAQEARAEAEKERDEAESNSEAAAQAMFAEKDRADAAEARAAKAEGEAKALRRLLWLRHGCVGLYGDDGEMQCGKCIIDFKRASPDEIADTWRRINARAALSAAPSAPQAGSVVLTAPSVP